MPEPNDLTPGALQRSESSAKVGPRPLPRWMGIGVGVRVGVGPQPTLSQVLVAVAELAVAAASVFLCLRLLSMSDSSRESFLVGNTLPTPKRAIMLAQLFASALLPVLVSGLFYLRRGLRGVSWAPRAAQVGSPLILAMFLPSLLDYEHWYDEPLPYLFQLAAFVLVLERLLMRALGSPTSAAAPYEPPTRGVSTRLSRALPLVVVLVFGLGYGWLMSHYTLVRHRGLHTAGFDLGIFDNLMFNAMHGRPFRSTVAVPGGSYLSNHAEYGMFLFVPIYALFPRPETLLVLQSGFIGLSAWPLYLFCSTQITRPAAAALACAYLFYAPLHGPNFYDFHWMPMAMFFVFWLFYAIARRKTAWIVVLGVVVCSMREDAAFALIASGLFLIVTRYWVRLGVYMTGLAAAWFVLVKFVIMPWAGPWWFADIYKDLVAHGEKGYGSIVRTILINPNYFIKTLLTSEKLTYALHLFAPLAFLPLRNPAQLLLMLPGFFVSLMTTGYGPTVSIAFQYTTTWIPFLFAASGISLRLRAGALGARAQRASVIALCVGVLCHSYVFGAILQHEKFVGGFSRVFFTLTPAEEQRYQDLVSLTKLIPKDVSVAATETVIPHVSSRLDAYTLKITASEADYILVYRHHLNSEAKRSVKDAMKARPYGLVAKQGDFYLFAHDHKSEDTEKTLRSLGLWSRSIKR